MTTARSYKTVDPGDLIICEAVAFEIDRQRRKARREGKPAMNQARVAAEVFGQPQQWLSRRLTGEIPFSAFELKRVGDYLGVNILDWYTAAKGFGDDTVLSSGTQQYLQPYVCSSQDETPEMARRTGHLTLVAGLAAA